MIWKCQNKASRKYTFLCYFMLKHNEVVHSHEEVRLDKSFDLVTDEIEVRGI